MLPAENRLRRASDFDTAMRHGISSGRSLLIVHVAHGLNSGERTQVTQVTQITGGTQAVQGGQATRVGFVVSGAVGGAVVRNTLRRRLRHVMRDRLKRLPPGAHVVVRARPGAANARTATLARSLDDGLDRALARFDRDLTRGGAAQ